VYRRERGPRRFGRKLDNGDNGERPRGAGSGALLARGEKARGSLRSYSTEVLGPRVGFPLRRGHQRGLVRTLLGSGYLGKNIGAIHKSLHLYLALYLPHLY
jgi:hypothetical protein